MPDGIELVDVAIIGAGEYQKNFAMLVSLFTVERLLTSTRMVWTGCGEDIPQTSPCRKLGDHRFRFDSWRRMEQEAVVSKSCSSSQTRTV